VAVITALLGFLGRFAGKVLTTTLGWASVLLFGRIPEDRQVRFSLLTFGSLIWVAAVVGIAFPAFGVFLISLVPLPEWIDEGTVRLVMLAAAVALPAGLGAVAMSIADPADRPQGPAMLRGLLRGFLLTPILAGTLVLLAVAGIVRKARAVLARRSSGHIPIVVRPGRYDALVARLDEILHEAKLVDGRRQGSRVLTGPARLLAAVSGTGLRSLVPHALQVLTGPEVEVEIYPSDVALSGSELGRARARAAILRELDSRDCWFTTSKPALEIEDRLSAAEAQPDAWDPEALAEVDRRLASEAIDDEAWDVLYRRRLQVAAKATGTNLQEPAEAAHAPNGAPAGTGRPDLGTLVGLVTAGLVVADILVLTTRDHDGRN
jgi:hypothetical protein